MFGVGDGVGLDVVPQRQLELPVQLGFLHTPFAQVKPAIQPLFPFGQVALHCNPGIGVELGVGLFKAKFKRQAGFAAFAWLSGLVKEVFLLVAAMAT